MLRTSSVVAIAWALLSFSGEVSGQEKIEVRTTLAKMSKGEQPGYVVDIPQSSLKKVQQNWMRKIQEGNAIKIKSSGQELVLLSAVKREFMPDTVNIYSIFIDRGNMISLYFFLEKDSVFFAPSEDKTLLSAEKTDHSIRNYLREFATAQYKMAVEVELSREKGTLKDLEDDMKNLQGKEDKIKRAIDDKVNAIELAERKVADKDLEIEMKNQEIITLSLSMQQINSITEREAAMDKKKELEKDKKSMDKERLRLKRQISGYHTGIARNNRSISELQGKQAQKQQQIVARQAIVAGVQEKLANIK